MINREVAWFRLAACLCLCGALIVANVAAAYSAGDPDGDTATAQAVQRAFIAVAEQLKPSTVQVTAEYVKTSEPPRIERFFRNFPIPVPVPKPGKQVAIALGSGVIVRSDGYILTSDHIVSGASRVSVKLRDGREFAGTVLEDPATDLALVKIDARNLPTANLADSDVVQVGEWAIAVGNPFELTDTVTVGVVSALTREAVVPDPDSSGTRFYPDLMQTDASINPGNSGGPLADIDGNVIGINAVMESPSGGNVGIGFAIPSNTAKFVMNQLITYGKVMRGYLGIEPKDVTAATAPILGTDRGALVQSVSSGSPAGAAGLRAMDVIVEVDDQQVSNAMQLRRLVTRLRPGVTVPVAIIRDKKRMVLQVKIGEAPVPEVKPPETGAVGMGLDLEQVTPGIAKELGAGPGTRGVVVTAVAKGGWASLADPPLSRGDVILRVNGKPVSTVSQFRSEIEKLKPGEVALVLFERKGQQMVSEMAVF